MYTNVAFDTDESVLFNSLSLSQFRVLGRSAGRDISEALPTDDITTLVTREANDSSDEYVQLYYSGGTSLYLSLIRTPLGQIKLS